jgi:hypothetical protein
VTGRHFLAIVALTQGVLLAALLILIVLNRWFRLRRKARLDPRRMAVEGVMQHSARPTCGRSSRSWPAFRRRSRWTRS